MGVARRSNRRASASIGTGRAQPSDNARSTKEPQLTIPMTSPSSTPRPAPPSSPTRRQVARGSRITIRAVTIVVPHSNGTVARANW